LVIGGPVFVRPYIRTGHFKKGTHFVFESGGVNIISGRLAKLCEPVWLRPYMEILGGVHLA